MIHSEEEEGHDFVDGIRRTRSQAKKKIKV